MFHKIVTALLIATSFSVLAQVDQSKRVELDLTDKDDIEVVTFQNKKSLVLLYNDENADTKKEKSIRYEYYDQALKKTLSRSILINEKLRGLASNVATKDALFSFYYDRKSDEIVIFRFEADKGEILEKRIGYKGNIHYFNELAIVGNTIFMAMAGKKSISCLVVDFEKASFKEQQIGGMAKKLVYHDLQKAKRPDGEEEVHFYCWKKLSRRNSILCYVIVDKSGNLKVDHLTELPQIDKDIKRTDATLAVLNDGSYMAFGTYTKGRQYFTNGIFLSKIGNNGNVVYDKTFNYLDLPNFTDYLSEKGQERIERKKERKEQNGKEYNINYLAVMHDIVEKNGNYLLICEFYYPTYRTETRTTCGTNGCRTTYHTVFDGYRYTHALIAGIDGSGNMRWSNIFELTSTYKPYYVKKFITVNKQGERINLIYTSGSYIYSKTFSEEGKVVSDDKSEIIDTDRDDDKIKSTSGVVNHWYDQHFIWHGYQKIKNTKDDDGKRKRKVYFMNKLTFVRP